MPTLKSQRWRAMIGWLAGVSLSVGLTLFLVSVELGLPDPRFFLNWSIGALTVTTMLAAIYFGWAWIDSRIWPILWKRRFRSSAVGVSFLEGAKPLASRYLPTEWYDWFRSQKLKARYIRPGESLSRVDILVNPYGEGYPEENALRLKSFEKIEDFVFNGGMFVSVGGYPFFYALDTHSKEPVALAPLVLRYRGKIEGQNLEIESVIRRGEKDLAQGTILATRFKLLTTLERSETVLTSQSPVDVEFAGNLAVVGGSDRVEQYRAIQAPAPVSHPILRATSQQFGEIYPLLALRYGRGFFVLGGMLLDVQPPNEILAKAAFEKSCHAVINIAKRIADGRIPAETA